MRFAVATLLLLLAATLAYSQPCLNAAKEVPPVLSPETKALYEKNLEDAEQVHLNKPNEADSIIWLGRRMAYLGRYKDAIRVFSSGSVLFKSDARFLRHRGHRYVTIRCFDDAIRDLQKAAELTEGKSDQIEADGIPNAKNTPTSTLQSNIWYHLGLAYYLKGDFAQALKAYEQAQKVSTNNDMSVATSYWQYMTLRRLGKGGEAKKILKPFAGKIELIENDEYLKLIRLNRGEIKPETLLGEIKGDATTLGSSSLGYGIGNYFLYNGDRAKAIEVFRKIVAGNQWSSFGYIAAEAELTR
ncbi:MAG TPA: tetratricopeptide repeat protein [Pyrinomonadaceae bacterium]|nr:tetratricopeptide repeat protein [Pyrinomonadaceae bacterium]